MWSRFRTEAIALAGVAALVAACGSAPRVPDPGAPTAPHPPPAPSPGDAGRGAGGEGMLIEVPPRAAADFQRAVVLMQAGNTAEAELEFQQLVAGYPQLAGPHANLGLLHRKAGRLEQAIASLRASVERNPASAVVWNELGVTLRLHGHFKEAAAAYERAINADPGYAPAHRNLGVLRDLYLGDAHGALAALEQYRSLSGEDKPVSGWIAELRQRTGTASQPEKPAVSAQVPASQRGEGESP
jgi:tetratricopeptide (TPR) repeat protein